MLCLRQVCNVLPVAFDVRKRSFLAVLKLNGASFQGSFVFAGLISSVKMSSV
jgi:hypothetical protein